MMRHFGFDDYGLVLDRETMKYIASKVCEDFDPDEYDKDAYDFNEYVCDFIGIACTCEFSGETFPFDENGRESYGDSTFYVEDRIYFIPAQNYPGLFTLPYASMEDLISEMRERVGEYLPPGFDIRFNIRHIAGTYYG